MRRLFLLFVLFLSFSAMSALFVSKVHACTISGTVYGHLGGIKTPVGEAEIEIYHKDLLGNRRQTGRGVSRRLDGTFTVSSEAGGTPPRCLGNIIKASYRGVSSEQSFGWAGGHQIINYNMLIDFSGVDPEDMPPCVRDPDGPVCECQLNNGTWTTFGCISNTPQDFVTTILRLIISISGGIAFLILIKGALMVLTSQGNPEKIDEGKSQITSAIYGLLFLAFSTVILGIIGVDILRLPGFRR